MRSLLLAGLLLGWPGLTLPDASARQPTSLPAQKVTLDLRAVPLRRALDQLFRGTGQRFKVAPEIANTPVTLNIRDMPFTTALRTLMRVTRTTYWRQGDVYMIGIRRPAPPQVRMKVTLELRDVPFHQALEQLFRSARLQHAIGRGVANDPVTFSVKDVEFESALGRLTRLAGATYRRAGEIYLIEKQKE